MRVCAGIAGGLAVLPTQGRLPAMVQAGTGWQALLAWERHIDVACVRLAEGGHPGVPAPLAPWWMLTGEDAGGHQQRLPHEGGLGRGAAAGHVRCRDGCVCRVGISGVMRSCVATYYLGGRNRFIPWKEPRKSLSEIQTPFSPFPMPCSVEAWHRVRDEDACPFVFVLLLLDSLVCKEALSPGFGGSQGHVVVL